MIFKVKELPVINSKVVRALHIKPITDIRDLKQITPREGLKPDGISEQLRMKKEDLKKIGITWDKNEDNISISLTAMRISLSRKIPDEIELRGHITKTVDNVLCTVIGRIGKEEDVLEEFHVDSAFSIRERYDKTSKEEVQKLLEDMYMGRLKEAVSFESGLEKKVDFLKKEGELPGGSVMLAIKLYDQKKDAQLLGEITTGIASRFHPDRYYDQQRIISIACREVSLKKDNIFMVNFLFGVTHELFKQFNDRRKACIEVAQLCPREPEIHGLYFAFAAATLFSARPESIKLEAVKLVREIYPDEFDAKQKKCLGQVNKTLASIREKTRTK